MDHKSGARHKKRIDTSEGCGGHSRRPGEVRPTETLTTVIEKELEEIHQQIDRIEEMIRKAFKENVA